MSIISIHELSKTYRVADKQPGFIATVKHFFNRQYRSIEAVKPCSFSIEPGEFVGFLGPNGAGKTTTLKMLSGLIHPTSGRIEIAGHVPFRRQHAFLNQITLVMGNKQQLIWDLPAHESLRINAAIYQVSNADFRKRLDELANLLDMTQFLSQPVRKLSLGQRMKAELIAALMHQPRVLFLDEPTLGLDVNAQSAVRKFLQHYNRTTGATILLTSHYMADITALCKRVLLIHHGSLFYDGTLEGIIDRFAPCREVSLQLSADLESAVLENYGKVESLDGRSAKLLIRRESLTSSVSQMLSALPISDLTVTDPPIEDIIGQLFTRGSVDAPASGVAS